MLIIIDGQIFDRRGSVELDRLVLSAAAYDGMPASGHLIVPKEDYVLCTDYFMVWGNLKYMDQKWYYGLNTQRLIEHNTERHRIKQARTQRKLLQGLRG